MFKRTAHGIELNLGDGLKEGLKDGLPVVELNLGTGFEFDENGELESEGEGGGGGGFAQGEDLVITSNTLTLPEGAENVFYVPASGTLRAIDGGDRGFGTVIYLHIAAGTVMQDMNGSAPVGQRIRLKDATNHTLSLMTIFGFARFLASAGGSDGAWHEISRSVVDTSEG